MNVTIENVRISYPTLFNPKQVAGKGDPKYSAAFIIAADNPGLKAVVDAASAAIQKTYPAGNVPANFKHLPLMKGEEKYPGKADYEGMYVLNSSNRSAPTVVDQQMNKVIDPGAVYPGMYVNVGLSVYTYNNVSKGVTCGLEAVQLVRDGERLDSRPSVNDLFKPIDVPGGAPAQPFNPLG